MSDSELDLSGALSPEVYRHLLDYQIQQGHPSLMVALDQLLQDYFAPAVKPEADQQQLDVLEGRVYTLTREVMLLRQSVPDQCDRLREQLAAVRLSHSGLLQNLRQRLEAVEQMTETSSDREAQDTEPTSGLNLS
ncbi:MAG: hypothetical protein ACFCU8_20795 [Thermosynechococcaceae cyanobacterium]